jgi:putative ABC transport system permease protein
MLKLKEITKDYIIDKVPSVHALRGISADFPDSGFVAVLGPSGCGKTTLLNIIGGLDRYTTGDLEVDGKSTVMFSDHDWDNYRNKKIGMVFQSYNLIAHMSVIENVELALTLSGVERNARKALAAEALRSVGLENEINKKPNHLSGGQMQRVAIARAIVNNPSIILADEPTGALDSKTSVQIMEILAEVSEKRLVIMVTHNRVLAEQYASRIIEMSDGKIIVDNKNNPTAIRQKRAAEETKAESAESQYTVVDESFGRSVEEGLKAAKTKKKLSSMSFWTALSISWKNLKSKKGRTILTSVAGSFGIIGVALVLAVSNGFTNYIKDMQSQTLAQFPVSVEEYYYDTSALTSLTSQESYPESHDVIVQKSVSSLLHVNNITDDYIDYVNKLDTEKNYASSVNLNYALRSNVITKSGSNYKVLSTDSSSYIDSLTSSSYWYQLPSNDDFVKDKYDVIEGEYPTESTDLVLIVNKYNSMSQGTLNSLGFDTSEEKIPVSSVLSKEFMLVNNDAYYTKCADSDRTSVTGRFLISQAEMQTKGMKLSKLLEYASQASSAYAKAKDIDDTTQSYLDKMDAFFNAGQETRSLSYFTTPSETQRADLYNSTDSSVGTKLKIKAILRPKNTSVTSMLTSGVYYRKSLSDYVIQKNTSSQIAQSYESNMCITASTIASGSPVQIPTVFRVINSNEALTASNASVSQYLADTVTNMQTYIGQRKLFGTDMSVSSITIYPRDFADKQKILDYLDAYNTDKEDTDQIKYTDLAGTLFSSLEMLVNIISAVLITFASISLVVSSVMIGIITYTSVIERTKEIGILRAIGARKKDVGRLFKAEACIIGVFSGLIGDLVAYALCIPISYTINAMNYGMNLSHIADLNPFHALILVAISVVLTFVASLIPSSFAAKQDPVVALRTE